MQTVFSPGVRPAGFFREVIAAEYRFALVPDQQIWSKLAETLVEAGLEGILPFQHGEGLVELAGFSAPPRLEETLARWTQRICSQQGGLTLEVNNFSGLPPHSVYLRVQDLTSVRELMTNLRKLDIYLTGNGEEALMSANRIMLMVAKGLPAAHFDNILYRLGRVEFHQTISIQSLVLQKKYMGKWITAQQFPFSAF